MNVVVLDFETFYSDEYTLSKMTTESYIRDPRFEAHGCAIRFPTTGTTDWWDGDELKQVFADIDWSKTAVLAHHAQFDGLILSHHYGVKPYAWFDTLSMARLLLGNHLSVGLDNLAKHFNLAAKTVPYNLFRGKRWSEITPDIQRQVADGAIHDVALTWQLFNILGKDMPREEYQVISTTVKMFTEPCLVGDIDMLGKVWVDEATKKDARMAALNVTSTELQSSDKFAELLRAEGVEPETKDGKNKAIYCFAKTDEFMRGLQEHDNERVRTLAEARLGAKSTLMQTRAETLGWMASRGPMPVYLRYCGAHTTRWSGGDGANWQNFKRGSDIRRAIMAPLGFLLGTIDLSQIECRILNYLAGQEDVIEKFRKGEDPYIGIASQAYGFPVTKAHVAERGTGKQLELSCGFQAGAATIQNTARLGIYGPPVVIDLATATRWRDIYRSTHPAVIEYWKTAGRMIARIAGGEPMEWGPMLIKDHKIFGPGGTMLHYETLQFHKPEPDEECKDFEREGYWRYRTRHGWTKLYSGKLVENVVQWLARIVMSQAMNRITALGYRVSNTTHDELLILIPKDGNEQRHLEVCENEMKRTPDWLPGIPLDCEGSLGQRYSK
jgi:DNA polymerase